MLKSTFNGFQRCRLQYGSIFIHLALVAAELCEIPRISLKIRTYSGSRSSKVIDLGVNRKLICNFLLVINSNYQSVSYSFRDSDAFSSKISCFPTSPLFDASQRSNALGYQRNLYTAGKYIQWATIPSPTLRVYFHSFSCYCLQKSRNDAKFRQNLTIEQFKVIQGHRS